MLTLEDLARDRLAERLREAERRAWLGQARLDAAAAQAQARALTHAYGHAAHSAAAAQVADAPRAVWPVHAPQFAAPRQALAAALRLLAARLDASLIVTSTRAESVPIQPHSRR